MWTRHRSSWWPGFCGNCRERSLTEMAGFGTLRNAADAAMAGTEAMPGTPAMSEVLSEAVVVERSGGVARIVLNRPEQGNSINYALTESLYAAATDVAADPSVRCVVLTGAGRMFCVGGDITEIMAAGDAARPQLKALASRLHDSVMVLTAMAKPLIVLVNGPAAGAGFSLAVMGDIVLASEAAHFTAAYTAIGLTPDGGLSWILPRLAGMRAAQELILTNRRVAAAEAIGLGLVTRTMAPDALDDEGMALAAKLAAGPVRSYGNVRRLLQAGQTRSLEAQLADEAETIAASIEAEGKEGAAAFLAKRKPVFD